MKPSAVVDQFQRERAHEVRESIINQRYHLRAFMDWAEEIELEDVTDLNGFIINQIQNVNLSPLVVKEIDTGEKKDDIEEDGYLADWLFP